MGDSGKNTAWQKRYLRERAARLEAETVAERVTRDLYNSIERLQISKDKNERLHTKLLAEKDKTIAAQDATILELTTPVVGIWEKILLLPLIGVVDTWRAQKVTGRLLDSINQTQATVVIVDITGVPVVDTQVADHLLKSVAAVRMLGAVVIVTGLNPHTAQTLVKLGADLSRIVTRSSLQAGLKLAFGLTKSLSQ